MSAHFAEELKIIKITCVHENNCTEQKLRPPADNLILLIKKKAMEKEDILRQFKLSKFLLW